MSSDPSTPEHASQRTSACVVLAAGQGTRMRSARPKVLHEVAGRAMLAHAIGAASAATPAALVVVVGPDASEVEAAARATYAPVSIATQVERRGTGHAVAQARTALEEAMRDADLEDIFVLYGDVPLIQPATLHAMAAARANGAAVVALGFEAADPARYGRLVRDADGALVRIVEARDASADELAITLCNSGVMCVDAKRLFGWLDQLDDDNAAGELYLTDVVALARRDGAACAVAIAPEDEVLGVNTRAELARAEAAFQARARAAAMAQGATLVAPDTVFFSADTTLGRDVLIGPNVVFGPGVEIADDVEIRAFCHLEGCRIASGAQIGPFARLRPGAEIGGGARVGNYVEVKNAVLEPGAKVNHLSYVGDAHVGRDANVGAGVITCNYDGFAKHRTEIGADAFVGSNAALVAPVSVGAGAIVGAGSTITRDVPDRALAVARGRQSNRDGLAALLKSRLAAAAQKAAKE